MTSIELSIGIQDKYLNINPQISFFKTVFRRHTNFSKVTERIENSSKAPTFGSSDLEFIIPQRGDLLNKLYFEVIIAGQSDTAAKHTVNHFGNSLIKTVALEIVGLPLIHIVEDGYKFIVNYMIKLINIQEVIKVKLILLVD